MSAMLRLIKPIWGQDGVPVCCVDCPCFVQREAGPRCQAETGENHQTDEELVCHAAVARIVAATTRDLEAKARRVLESGMPPYHRTTTE